MVTSEGRQVDTRQNVAGDPGVRWQTAVTSVIVIVELQV